jgi:hypothetical protein
MTAIALPRRLLVRLVLLAGGALVAFLLFVWWSTHVAHAQPLPPLPKLPDAGVTASVGIAPRQTGAPDVTVNVSTESRALPLPPNRARPTALPSATHPADVAQPLPGSPTPDVPAVGVSAIAPDGSVPRLVPSLDRALDRVISELRRPLALASEAAADDSPPRIHAAPTIPGRDASSAATVIATPGRAASARDLAQNDTLSSAPTEPVPVPRGGAPPARAGPFDAIATAANGPPLSLVAAVLVTIIFLMPLASRRRLARGVPRLPSLALLPLARPG